MPLTFFASFFRDRPTDRPLRLLQFSDASFANRPGSYPQLCGATYLAWDMGTALDGVPMIEVSKFSKKSARVATSSCAGETLALVKATEHSFQFHEWWFEFHCSLWRFPAA